MTRRCWRPRTLFVLAIPVWSVGLSFWTHSEFLFVSFVGPFEFGQVVLRVVRGTFIENLIHPLVVQAIYLVLLLQGTLEFSLNFKETLEEELNTLVKIFIFLGGKELLQMFKHFPAQCCGGLIISSHSLLNLLTHKGWILALVEAFIQAKSLVEFIYQLISIFRAKYLADFFPRVVDRKSSLDVLDVLRSDVFVCQLHDFLELFLFSSQKL